MKYTVIAITSLAFLFLVFAEESDKSSSKIDHLDIFDLAKNEADETKSSEVQRKRDSGYAYSRPDRFLSSQRHEPLRIRGRIVTKRPSGQTVRPFNQYGLPKYHQQSGGNRNNHHQNQQGFTISGNEFTSGHSSGHQQEVPSPMRQYDFVEPSPIAGQNDEPFNSNGANYLPPKNQKLPGYSNPHAFSNQQQSPRFPNEHQFQMTSHHDQRESFNNHQQSQSLLQMPFNDQQQISDAAIFLAQNSQAISQLYDTPATNLNYEPYHEPLEGSVQNSQNLNNQFQTFDMNDAAALNSQGLQESRGFQGTLPSYASGILDRETLQGIKSLEKDRLIARLQQALVSSQSNPSTSSTSERYAQNNENGNYIQSQSLLVSQGQIRPSIGPQLDRPSKYNPQRPFGATTSAVGPYIPVTSSTIGEFTYGLPSTTPATQSPSTTTSISTTISSATQRPSQGATSEGSSQTGTSVSAPGTPAIFPFPQYGGFVPSLIGTNLIANYPTYGTNFLGSSSSSVNHVQSSSPTHFGIPIPSLPANQGTTTIPSNPPSSQKPDTTSGHHNHHSTPLHTIPIQPIHPIVGNPVQTTFPIVPAVTQIHPVQAPLVPTSGHPTYGVQPALVNPLLVKPIKPLYPVYYYPNVYQLQKPGLATLPWNYAPSYAQTKPAQIWK